MLDGEGGRAKTNERTGGRDGRGRRQALIKNGAARRTAGRHHPACRERERGQYIRIGGQAEFYHAVRSLFSLPL